MLFEVGKRGSIYVAAAVLVGFVSLALADRPAPFPSLGGLGSEAELAPQSNTPRGDEPSPLEQPLSVPGEAPPAPYPEPQAPAPVTAEGEVPLIPPAGPLEAPAEQPLIRPFADVAAGAGFSAIAFGDTYTPNMMGDLLGTTSSVAYSLARTGAVSGDLLGQFRPASIDAFGKVFFRNAKVAENNSPLPRDRVTFRYNYFHNAVDIRGYTLDGAVQVPQLPGTIPNQAFVWVPGYPDLIPIDIPPELAGQEFFPVVSLQTVDRSYHVNLFTFAAEKTLAGDLLSFELRLPFSSSLASNLDLSTGIPGQTDPWLFNVTPTPEQTLGHEATEWGNMTLILKGLLHRTKKCAVSGGLAMGVPSGPDTDLTITDYYSYFLGFTPEEVGSAVPGPRFLNLGLQAKRTRLIEVENRTWSLSPYFAGVYTPSRRLFRDSSRLRSP